MRRFFREFRVRKEAKHAEAIIWLHHKDSFFSKILSVVARLGIRASDESSTVEPHKYRQFLASGLRGQPDIQVEAVFTGLRVAKINVAEDIRLQASGSKLVRLAHAGPSRCPLRLLPSQVTY